MLRTKHHVDQGSQKWLFWDTSRPLMPIWISTKVPQMTLWALWYPKCLGTLYAPWDAEPFVRNRVWVLVARARISSRCVFGLEWLSGRVPNPDFGTRQNSHSTLRSARRAPVLGSLWSNNLVVGQRSPLGIERGTKWPSAWSPSSGPLEGAPSRGRETAR